MVSDARIRATNKFIKEKTRRFTIQCHKEYDKDIIELLESKPNYNAYLKDLIRRELRDTSKA